MRHATNLLSGLRKRRKIRIVSQETCLLAVAEVGENRFLLYALIITSSILKSLTACTA